MAANPDLFEQWKKEAKYSDQYHMTQTMKEEETAFEDDAKRFFGCTQIDDEVRNEEIKKATEANSTFALKNQFLMNSKGAKEPTHHHDDNIDFQTSNAFYHSLTKSSVESQLNNHAESDVLNDLDPEVFEVTAKKQNSIWKTNTYGNIHVYISRKI